MRMNHQLAEPFIITGIRKPKNCAPVRTLLRVHPAIKFAIMVQETPPAAPKRRVNWDRVLGLAIIVVVNGAAWSAVAIAISHLLR